MRIAVISSDYTGPDLLYGDTFVHTRVKHYMSYCDVSVFGFNSSLLKDRVFEYEGVSVCVTNNLTNFSSIVSAYNPDVIAVHLLQQPLIDTLVSFNKPVFVFVHGYEALSWKRRLMNYTTIGDLRYLWPFFLSNRKQLKSMKALGALSNEGKNIHFVFVSMWLKRAVEFDWKMQLKNTHVIPNGIDISRFIFNVKSEGLRKNILLLRSFKARNYANDIAIDAILLLSKKPFFKELNFSIFGEGYLFPSLAKKISHFSNVQLNNFFVDNKNIPIIHSTHGIFLCPSRLDTQGVSMCEAMSSGLVPITCPVGGIPEYATDNHSSFQVKTAEEIADKIEFLYRNPEAFLKMSCHANKEIENKCNLFNTCKREIELLERVTLSR